MAVLYVEVDEEITGALSRVRGSPDRRVALVLPPGSRIATGRINFRLLARGADAAGRELAIVCPDEGTRQLAVSAGLPAYASLGEYETAAASGDPLRPSPLERPPTARFDVAEPESYGGQAASSGRRAARRAELVTAAAATRPGSAAAGATGGAGRASGERTLVTRPAASDDFGAGAPARARAAGRRSPLFLVAGAVLALLVTGVAAAVTVLPSATIRLTPRSEPTGPVRITVVADPAAEGVDPEANVIPARVLPITLTASGTFDATGREVRSTRAGGRVRFLSENTVNDVPVAAGTRVATKDGVEFETREAVTVPQATFDPPERGTVEVEVIAARPGTEGNVPAEAIQVLPQALAALEIRVTNPVATTGGTRTETRFVSRADYDDAVKALGERLDGQLQQRLGDPGTFPEGVVVQRASVRRGDRRAEPAAGGLVGEEQERFELAVEETATVLGVDERRIVPLAEAALRARLPDGRQVVPGSVRVASRVTAAGRERIEYAVEARGAQSRAIDAGALLAEIRGKPLAEAERILGEYGQVRIETWPGYVTSIPTMEGRASLTIAASTSTGS